MAENRLSKLLSDDKYLKSQEGTLGRIDSTLDKLFKLEKKEYDDGKARQKKEDQAAKRAAGDRKTQDKLNKNLEKLIASLGKSGKGGAGGAGGSGGFLKGLGLAGAGVALTKLLTGLSGMAKTLTGAKLLQTGAGALFGKGGLFGKIFGKKGFFAGMVGSLKKLLSGKGWDKLFGKGGKGLFKGIGKGLKIGGIFTALFSGITTYFESGDWLKAVTVGLGAGTGSVVGGLLGSIFGPIGTVAGAAIGGIIGDWLGNYVYKEFPQFFAPIKKVGDDIGNFLVGVWDWMKPFFDGLMEGLGETWAALSELFGELGRLFTNVIEKILAPAFDRLKVLFTATLDNVVIPGFKLLGKFLSPVAEGMKFLGELFNNVFTPELRNSIGKFFGGLAVNPLKWLTGLVRGANNTLEGKQTGGPVTVPGSGSGDKVPMMLPSGSFVLNRNASGFQNGGIIPTMLEPGEKVYGPGQWGANEFMMNSMIPRFQTGGVVKADHPDTGAGWSIGKDQQGRPSVFTKEAGSALAKAINDSGGAVKTSDITSSKRSPSKNAAVGGVPNSNHLYGNAVDIHGSSKAWLKANGLKYGWKNLVYSGHDGHFDFTEGSTPVGVPGDGKEKTADTDGSKGGGLFGTALKLTGAVGSLVGDMAKIMGETFGDDLMSIFGGGGALGSLTSQIAGGGGGGSPSSPGGAFGESSLIAAMNKAGMKNKKERAMFLAQMSHESGNFRYDEEIHDGSNYEGRSDLGNTQRGDGKRYKGRGYIQLTGRSNYAKYGKMVGHDLVGNPDLAKDPNVAADVALAYWRDRGISSHAQSGDIRKVTRIINGGYNGLADRENKYAAYMAKGMQTGGVVGMKGTSSGSSQRFEQAQMKFADRIAEGVQPIVVPMPAGGGGAKVVRSSSSQTTPPSLPAGPSSLQAAEYLYRLNMANAF